MGAAGRTGGFRGLRPEMSSASSQLLVLMGVSGFAISQPLLSVLGYEPMWFTYRSATAGQIVVFALLVALAVPAILWCTGLALRRVAWPVGSTFHLLTVGGLATLAAVQWFRSIVSGATVVPAVLAVLVGTIFVVAYARVELVGLWVRYTAVLPLFALVSFLFMSPTGELVRGDLEVSGATPPGATRPSVLFIMLDELPTQSLLDASGGIDRVRFPNLASLADDGTWYPTYSSTASFTKYAVPSILSGQEPANRPPTFMGYPRNLFSLLAPSHEMRVRETLVALCDRSTCPPIGSRRDTSGVSIVRDLLAAGTGVLRQRTAEWTPPKREVGDPRVRAPQAQADLLSAIEPIDEPTLWYLHLLLPHRPWLFYPDGGTYSADGLREWRNRADPWITAIEEQRHLLQLQYADTLVGEVLDALRATGQYDDTVVVVTADHGFSFVVDAPARDPVEANLAQLAYVPLIIKAPGGEPQVPADSNILSYDLLPTLAELLGVDIPWAVHGHPIGSTDQLDRGPEKEMYGASTGDGLERLTFDARTPRPSFAGRQVGPIQRGDDPIAGLLRRVDVDPWLGRPLDEITTAAAEASAQLSPLQELRDPGRTRPGLAFVDLAGDVRREDKVLLEVNGTVVTAAPVTSGAGRSRSAVLLLPPGALRASGNELAVAIVRGDQVLRVAEA